MTDYDFCHVERARDFAIKWHGDQKYGNEPYIVHLDHVNEITRRFELPINIQIAAYLHDILEDTDCIFEEVWDEFGWEIAQLVFLVTDEDGDNRRERKQKTYPKISSNPGAVLLKICDRLANIEQAKQNNIGLFNMYKREHNEFLDGLCIAGTRYGLMGEMVGELDNLLND